MTSPTEPIRALARRICEYGPPLRLQTFAAFEWDADLSRVRWTSVGVSNGGDRWTFDLWDDDTEVAVLAEMFRDALPGGWSHMEMTLAYDLAFSAYLGHGPVPPGPGLSAELWQRVNGYPDTWRREHGGAPHGT